MRQLDQPESSQLLPREFFERPSVQVAPDLLGCVISHSTAAGLVAVILVEVEAYAGEADPASHAFRGRTARNAVMYGPPGHAYVYFTYGMHFCVNLVCQPPGHASAVLLRAGRVVDGVALAWERRFGSAGGPEPYSRDEPEKASRPDRADGLGGVGGPGATSRPVSRQRSPGAIRRELDLARGPARLCEALGIDRSHDGTDVADPASPLRVFAPQVAVHAGDISRGPRVGISRATDVAWRFWVTGEPAVSPYRAHTPRKRAVAKPVTGRARGDGTMHQ